MLFCGFSEVLSNMLEKAGIEIEIKQESAFHISLIKTAKAKKDKVVQWVKVLIPKPET